MLNRRSQFKYLKLTEKKLKLNKSLRLSDGDYDFINKIQIKEKVRKNDKC